MNLDDLSTTAIVVAVLVFLVGLGGAMAYEQVPEGHEGVVLSWGAVSGETFEPGANWVLPVRDGVQNVEVRPRTYTMSAVAGEGDNADRNDAVKVTAINGTEHDVDITVRYRVDEDRAARFVTQWNTVDQVEERLIRPTVRSRLRDEAAAIQTSQIYTREGRDRLEEAATQALKSAVEDEAIVLEAVQIRDVTLPSDYAQSLREKERAKVQVEEEENRIEVERKKAEQERIQAQADADVIDIRGDALRQNPEVLQLRYIQAINPTDKVILGGGDTPIILDAAGMGQQSNVTNETSAPDVSFNQTSANSTAA